MEAEQSTKQRYWARRLAGVAALVVLAAVADSRTDSRTRTGRADSLNDDEPNALVFGRFKFEGHMPTPDEWDTLPNGDENLLRYVARLTNIRISKKTWKERVVEVDDFEKMHTTPILFMTGQVDFDFTTAEVEAINEYFKRGGFLYADDCDADSPNGLFFFPAFLREMERFPDVEARPLPPSHEIYHCFFDMPNRSPTNRYSGPKSRWCDRYPDTGLFVKNRMVGFLTASDQHCGWAGRRSDMQAEALKMGTNIIVYALTH